MPRAAILGRKDGTRLECYCDTMLDSRHICGDRRTHHQKGWLHSDVIAT